MNKKIALLVCLGLIACSAKRSQEREEPSARHAAKAVPVSRDATPPPDAVSGASAVEADGGAAQPDELGERTLRLAEPLRHTRAADAAVYVARGDDTALAIRRVLDGVAPKIPAGARVMIKINLGGHDNHGMAGRITDPKFVAALIAELRRRGVRDLVVADGASIDAKAMERELSRSGYREMLHAAGVSFVNLNHYGETDRRPRPWHIVMPWAKHLSRGLILSHELVDPGRRVYLIDVPKIKAHRYAVMSMSIKNLMGAVMLANPGGAQPPWKRRWKMHGELAGWMRGWRKSRRDDRALYKRSLALFSERLADLWGAITPDLVILEGMPASQGDGFRHAQPYGGGGIVIASRNGCYADYVGAEFFGLHDSDELEAAIGYRMPPAIAAVAERYYGGVAALRKIRVRGDVAWRKQRRPVAWLKAMAPFSVGSSR